MTVERTADILAALARVGPATGWPGHLVQACRTALDVTGVGLAVMNATGSGGVLGATSGCARDMEDLQFVVGEHETFAVANLIRRLHRNSAYTIVLIEHDMRVVFNLADRITVLGEGKMLAECTPTDIANNPIVQEAYLGKTE